MADFRTWLLSEDIHEPALGSVLKSVGQSQALRQLPVLASLRTYNNQAILRVKDKDLFSRRLMSLGREEYVDAISLAPCSEIRFFHRLKFLVLPDSVAFEIRACEDERNPYARRFVRFIRGDVTPAAKLTNSLKQDHYLDACLPDLWVDPPEIKLFGPAADKFFANDLDAITRNFFLPPVRTTENEQVLRSYFGQDATGEDLSIVRSKLIDAMGRPPSDSEPSQATLVRLVDSMLLRDFLLDGGSIELLAPEGLPTSVELRVFAGDRIGTDAIAYRTNVLLFPEMPKEPHWAGQFSKAIRGDIDSLPGRPRLPTKASDAPQDWAIRSFPETGSPTSELGLYDYFQELNVHLTNRHPAVRVFSDLIFQQADAPIGGMPNHDLAMRAFLENLWRCPSADIKAEEAWRQAVVECLILGNFLNAWPTPKWRVDQWNEHEPGRYYVEPGTTHLHYYGEANETDLLRLRFLLPLGWSVSAKAIYLNRKGRSELDADFVLG